MVYLQEEEQEHHDGPEIIDGIRVKRSGKRGKAGTSGAGSRPQLEKPVVNCLACGKVYDCRPVTNDIINFLGVLDQGNWYLKSFFLLGSRVLYPKLIPINAL